MAADEGHPVWLFSKQLNWSEQSFKESLSSLRGISLQVLDIGLQSKPSKTFQQTLEKKRARLHVRLPDTT